jgi:hypothetical protein
MKVKYKRVRLVTVKDITVLKIEVIEPVFVVVVSVAHPITGLIWVKCHNFLFSIRTVLNTGKF